MCNAAIEIYSIIDGLFHLSSSWLLMRKHLSWNLVLNYEYQRMYKILRWLIVPRVQSLIVYLCICVFVFFVFALLTHRNIIFDILEQSSFQKYTTCWVFLALCLMLYLCICVFLYLYFCICAFDTWEYHFWYTWTILFSKIYYMLGLSGTLSYAVLVCLCVCVFVYLYLGWEGLY